MVITLLQNLIILKPMLSLEFVMVTILYTESAYYSWFINIYTFVNVLLLTFLCVESSSIW